MTAADKSVFASAIDRARLGRSCAPASGRPINERYPGSMIRKENFVPQAHLTKPLAASRLTVVSSCGVHLKTDQPWMSAIPLAISVSGECLPGPSTTT